MTQTLEERFRERLGNVQPSDARYATEAVETILREAGAVGASDVHLLPAEEGLQMAWRIDGVLQPIMSFPREVSPNIVSRLKVLSELLTYQTDVPQEGRIRETDGDVETRVSTFPTLYGEKAVVRLFVGSGGYRHIENLQLPADISQTLTSLLQETGGVILVTGPAGSGKTTTLYACLRELITAAPVSRSIATLEDPIEAVVPGVAQSQIRPHAGFDYEKGLKSLLRQDPEVIMVGEIRDQVTAETVFQASLTGHLVLTTFHAGSAAETVGRLMDMGIEPYLLRSGVLGVLSQRLVRQLCDCKVSSTDADDRMGLDVSEVHIPAGCDRCGGTGYSGRIVLAEFLCPRHETLNKEMLSRNDAHEIEKLAIQAGMISQRQRALDAVAAGLTSPAEIRRVLGFRKQN